MGPEVMLAATFASGAMSAIGSIQQGEASASAAKYQAQVARNNAEIARQNAEYEVQAGEVASQNLALKQGADLGLIRASQAASNVSLSSPSLQNVYRGAQQIYSLEREYAGYNAGLRARAQQVKGAEYLAEADLQTAKAKDARTAGYIGAVGAGLTTLTNASSVSAKWDSLKTKPTPFYTGDA